MNVMETLAKRQSCRAFTAEQITEDQLDTLLQAAQMAPVAMRRYEEVAVSVVQDPAAIAQMEACLGAGEHPAYGAPTVLLISGDTKGSERTDLAYCNASCMAQNVMLAATSQGLASIYLYAMPKAMQRNEAACAAAHVPAGFTPLVAVGVGHSQEELPGHSLEDENYRVDFVR